MKYFLALLSLALLLPNFFSIDISPKVLYNHTEKFEPTLSYLNTIDKLDAHVDSIANSRSIVIPSIGYVEIIDTIIQQRFYHGFSHYSLKKDWIAALAGEFFWNDLSCKVKPEGIIRDNDAGCSQQAIVMMAVLRKKGIFYRSIGFPHHYALEVLINNKWYFFDTDKEPAISGEQRAETNWNGFADSLKKYYINKRVSKNDLDFAFGVNKKVIYGPINEIPAPHQRIFETITIILSKTLWILPLLLIFYPKGRLFSNKNQISI